MLAHDSSLDFLVSFVSRKKWYMKDKYEIGCCKQSLVCVKIKKEVIQPQVPLRLPCDDLTHLTELRFTVDKGSNVYLNPARLV